MDRLTMDGPLNRWLESRKLKPHELAAKANLHKSEICRARSGRQTFPQKLYAYWRATGVLEGDIIQMEAEQEVLMSKRRRIAEAERRAA
jgi:hypothetical protein